MYSPTKIIITIGLVCAFVLAATAARAVEPPPDGGYPNANTAEGEDALFSLTTGIDNTASGFNALYYNTTGFRNTANGAGALQSNTTGRANTATGCDALNINTTGQGNTATGYLALAFNTTGTNNIAIGTLAGFRLIRGDNNIEIGHEGVRDERDTIRIGTRMLQKRAFIAGISAATVTGTAVVVDSNGQLGVAPSSQRFKQNIETMGDASDILLALRPVTFRYKKDLDPEGVPQFGLVAEEVEKVSRSLVARDEQGKPYTVRYEAVNAMLLNEFLKEDKKVAQLQATVAQQEKDFQAAIAKLKETVAAQLNEQAAQIQKVSDQLEASKPAPQMVNNP